MLAVVVALLILLANLAKQAKSQPNNALSTNIHPLAVLTEGVLYKNASGTLERTRIAEEIYRAERLVGRYGGSCVQFVRWFTGNSQIKGTAKNLGTNSKTPQIGGVVKTRESYLGHTAVILYIQDEQIFIVESNYGWDNKIGIRWLNINNPLIEGYLLGGDL